MENINPQELEKWIAILGKPTLGVVAFIIVILYRDTVQYFCKAVIDLIFRRKIP